MRDTSNFDSLVGRLVMSCTSIVDDKKKVSGGSGNAIFWSIGYCYDVN